ncbi:MAG: flagellar export chaperone FlgN [Spirochaetaceae bacterium]
MNVKTVAIEVCDVIRAQIMTLETIAAEHSRLQEAVMNRDWESLEEQIRVLQAHAHDAGALEEQRKASYGRLRKLLGFGAEESFFELLCRLEDEERTELAALYRGLKIAVMRVASANGGLEAYVQSSTQTIEEVLKELFPERKGTIYSRTGRVQRHDDRAFVVNQSL